MKQVEPTQIQLMRVNPFSGLMIDADIWSDAHEYHRDQARLHQLALHGWGIVQGLEVTLGEGPNELTIGAGIGVVPDGRFVVVPESVPFMIRSQRDGTIYLVLQFDEAPAHPVQPAGSGAGQPSRLIERFRIENRTVLPDEPYLELARIQFDPAYGPVVSPRDPARPGINELDTRERVPLAAPSASSARAHRLNGRAEHYEAGRVLPDHRTASAPALTAPPLRVALGLHGGLGWDCHLAGLRHLAREVERATGRSVQLAADAPAASAGNPDLLYVTGHDRPLFTEADEAGIRDLLARGGAVIGEGCTAGPNGVEGALAFGDSFLGLARRIGQYVTRVERNHPLLAAHHIFSSTPLGSSASAVLLEAGGMTYSNADYGCAWQGGSPNDPLPRAVIREAFEFSVNLAVYRPSRPS